VPGHITVTQHGRAAANLGEAVQAWLEADRYLNMDDLREHKKEARRMAA
jgi:hypothetical protein